MSKKPQLKLIYRIIQHRRRILEIAERNGVENVRVFGSASRKQDTRGSDIDLLVDLAKKPDGTRGNYINFALDLQSELFRKRKVEVCTPETLHPRFKDKVLANCVSIMIENPDDIDDTQVDERDYVVNVEKSQKAIKHFWEVIELGKEKFVTDRTTQNDARSEMQKAVEEIVRTIPEKIQLLTKKEIDWHGLRKFRNFLVHHYDNVMWDIMWETAQEKMKETEKACERVLEILREMEKDKEMKQ